MQLVSFIVGLLVLTLLGVGTWTWAHPSTFGEGHSLITADTWKSGEAIYTGLTSADPQRRLGTVTIASATPHNLNQPDAAKVGFYVCTLNPTELAGGIGSASESDIKQSCGSLVPATDAKMDLDARPAQFLLMKITPTRPGQVITVQGADVTYRHGWQRGTQTLGSRLRIRTLTN